MLKRDDSVMFATGRTSKIFKVTSDQFSVDGESFVTIEGYRGQVNVSRLVKMQNMFDEKETDSEITTVMIESEETGEPKERYILNDEDKEILREIKSHIGLGIRKLKKRGVRSVNIQLELTQFMLEQLKTK